MPDPLRPSSAATLAALAEQVNEHQHRLLAIVADLDDGRHDDVVRALYETERNLRSAGRALRRARKLL